MIKKIRLINEIAIHKIKLQYADQIFGKSWAIINPLVYVLCYWFFYVVGMRGTGEIDGVPYILWLVPGVMVFRYMVGCLNLSTKILTGNAMLIRNIKFQVSLIPIIEMLKELYIHIGTMIALGLIFVGISYSATGTLQYAPDIYYVNFLFYIPLMFLFTLSYSIPFCVLGLLIKDTRNLVMAVVQPLFWITPVGFVIDTANTPHLELLEKLLNPFYYFIVAYRNTFLYDVFFWHDIKYTLYMFIVIIVNFTIGIILWKKVRPYMSDLF